jgi:carboxypeptidase PM20D1
VSQGHAGTPAPRSARRAFRMGGTALAAIVVLVLGVVVVKTLTVSAPHVATIDAARLPPAVKVDVDGAARHLGEAVRFRTVSHQDPAADERVEWDRLQAWLLATYPAAHAAMNREVIAERTLLYTWPGREPALAPVILMAHQDVVPAAEETAAQWRHPPFSGELADGAVWGRGTIDDKGSLVALFEALDALAASGFRPRRTLLLVSGADEEVGGTGARAVAAALAVRGVRAEFVLDEGLIILDRHPVTRAPAALIGVAEKGYGTLEVVARAAGGHSSMPPDETADLTLAKALVAISRAKPPLRLAGPTEAMLQTLAPDSPPLIRMAIANEWLFAPLLLRALGATPAGTAMLRTTMAPTMLAGSPKENVLPERASVAINYRLFPGDRSADIAAAARRAVGELPVEINWLRPPIEASPVSSTSSRGWALLAALAGADAHGPVAPALFIGGTDSLSMQSVAADVYRFQPITLGDDELAMIHGTNEHMSIANFGRAIAFYSRLIQAAAE